MENLIGYVKHSILNFGTSEMSLSIFRVIGHKIKGYFLLSKHLFQKKRPHQWGKCQKTAIFFPQKPQKAFAEDARIEKMRTFVTCKEKTAERGSYPSEEVSRNVPTALPLPGCSPASAVNRQPPGT